MGEVLWNWHELVDATGGSADLPPSGPGELAITGVSIDSRDLTAGDLFVALTDQRDGHEFVPAAFRNGACAALVRSDYIRAAGDGALIRVEDPLAALERLATRARSRLDSQARIVAITGSAGKTTTKEMLRACFEATAPGRVHASVKSYNNHWGVPLTLARMPASTTFAVIEIGMNHKGEIRTLTKLARPHVAVVTTIAPAHIGNFSSLDEVAEAKAEIFEGLRSGTGRAILPRDSAYFDLLSKRACSAICDPGLTAVGPESVLSFGCEPHSDVYLDVLASSFAPNRTHAVFRIGGQAAALEIGVAGRHNALNAGAVIASWLVATSTGDRPLYAGAERLAPLREALSSLRIEPAGRGQIHELENGITLIDESYNANPASMRAALATLALYPRQRRRIAVLGDMLELGDLSVELHIGLKQAIDEAGVDLVFASGASMCELFHKLETKQRGLWADATIGMTQTVVDLLRPGDVVMVKGSLGSRMAPVVVKILNRYRGDKVAE